MKTLKIIFSFTAFILFANYSICQFQVRNDPFIQIGYEDYRTLSFGEESNSPNNGKYAIEYWTQGDGGLNFWKPWPTQNSANYVLWLRNDRNVAIGGEGSEEYKLMVYGNAFSTGDWVGSDRKLKTNIEALENNIEKILALQPKSYLYDFKLDKYTDRAIDEELDVVKKRTMEADKHITHKSSKTLGFIADEVQKIFPELVKTDSKGISAINYDGMIPVLVSAIQAQQKQIAELQRSLDLKTDASQSDLPMNDKMHSSLDDNTRLLFNAPNPFSDYTKISYFISKEDMRSSTVMLIYNSSGKLIFEKDLDTIEGQNTIDIDLSSQSSGMYVYSLLLEGKTVDSKTMVISK